MKRWNIGFLVCLGALMIHASTITAPAADFTCQVYGGSFILDDTDFKALKDSWVTKETFAPITPTRRASICDSRKLWRLIKGGKFDQCDFAHYKNYNALYFDDSEVNIVITSQGKVFGKRCLENSK